MAPGDPMLIITTPGLNRRFYRCPTCAGEEAPPDLPLNIVRVIDTTPRPPLALKSMLPLDWKRKQTGEREPGEEG